MSAKDQNQRRSDEPEEGEHRALQGVQEEQAQRHAPLRPKIIHEIIREEGEEELRRPVAALAWSGLTAGLSMGFSFLTQALLQAGLPDTPWRPLISSLGYSVGFAVVVLGRQQLFTESTLTAVLPVLTKPERKGAVALARLWSVVLVANMVGAALFAAALRLPGVLPPEAAPSLQSLAQGAVRGPFWPTLGRAVFAGWLIALMVWILPSARSARILVIVLLTWLVALGRFSHIVAGATEAVYAMLGGQASLAQWTLDFFVPTLVGNVLGGAALVAMLNHAPVARELETGVGGGGRGRGRLGPVLLSRLDYGVLGGVAPTVAAPWTLASEPDGEAVEEPVVQVTPLAVPAGVAPGLQAGLTWLYSPGAAAEVEVSSVAQALSAAAAPTAARPSNSGFIGPLLSLFRPHLL